MSLGSAPAAGSPSPGCAATPPFFAEREIIFAIAKPKFSRGTDTVRDRRMIERRITRLYVAAGLSSRTATELVRGQGHYWRSVWRLGAGAAVGGFTGPEGEWLGRVSESGKGA